MKNINKIYTKLFVVLFACSAVLLSCEKPVDIQYLDMDPKVVVESVSEVDSVMDIRLTYSRWFLSNESFKEISDADITLKVNGNVVDDITYGKIGESEKIYYTVNSYVPKENDELELTIQVPGEEVVTSSCVVPSKPEVSDLNTEEYYEYREYESWDYMMDTLVIIKDSNYSAEVSFVLNDNPDKHNYYKIEVLGVYDYGAYVNHQAIENCYFELDDMLLTSDIYTIVEGSSEFYGNEFIFSDEKINGQNYPMKIQISNYEYYHDYCHTYYLKISELTEDMYRFLQTKTSSSDELNTMLGAEPTQIFSNIDNGIGIFAVSSPKLIKLDINTNNK